MRGVAEFLATGIVHTNSGDKSPLAGFKEQKRTRAPTAEEERRKVLGDCSRQLARGQARRSMCTAVKLSCGFCKCHGSHLEETGPSVPGFHFLWCNYTFTPVAASSWPPPWGRVYPFTPLTQMTCAGP